MESNINLSKYFLDINDKDVARAYGESLKALREHTNTKQKDLAEATKVSRQSISVYERGEVVPTISQAMRICAFFRMDIDAFILYGLGMGELVETQFTGDLKTITDYYDLLAEIS